MKRHSYIIIISKGVDITMPLFFIGLFLFLMGLESCKIGLNKVSSKKIEEKIAKTTDKLWVSLLIGILATAILQSSSALSIIIIGLLEAELIKFRPALVVMFGANIGTTFTVQLISLPILSSYHYIIIAGFAFILISYFLKEKLNRKTRLIGFIIVSFGIVFTGLYMMTEALNKPIIYSLFKKIISSLNNNIILGVFSGAFTTAIIQSSSAVTGLLVSLTNKNMIQLPLAVAAAMGSNIGTCITAFLASFKGGKWAKLLALGHFLFNLFGVVIILFFFNYFIYIIKLSSYLPSRQLANAHLLFNIFTVILIIPFFKIILNWLEA